MAGRRAGLAGERSGLFFEFMRIVGELTPGGVLIENVPGLLSSNEGRDMGIVLRALDERGYGWAYRSLDAQYAGLAQRRERVFIVGCLGDTRRAAEILFERESLPWDSPPSRQAGESVAPCVRGGTDSGSNEHGNKITVSYCLNGKNGKRFDGESETMVAFSNREINSARFETLRADSNGALPMVAHALRSEGADASEDGTGRGTPVVPVYCLQHAQIGRKDDAGPQGKGWQENLGFTLDNRSASDAVAFCFDERNVTSKENRSNPQPGDPCHTLHSDPPRLVAGFKRGQGAGARSDGWQEEQAPTLTSADSGTQLGPGVQINMAVRRLTPRECERLQGFPDDWTRYADDGKEISDSARYRMLGNAVAVPVAEWIGRRLVPPEGFAAAEMEFRPA